MLLYNIQTSQQKNIILCITENIARPSKFDVVAVSPRNDYGFGFSQIDRFVKKADSDELISICNDARENNEMTVLPAKFSYSKIVLTPTIKKNDDYSQADARNTMLKLLHLCSSFEIDVDSLLITHFRFIRNYKENHILGILDAVKTYSSSIGNSPRSITIEMGKHYFDKVDKNIKSVLNDSNTANLEDLLKYAHTTEWCVSSFCKTCGNKDFRKVLSTFNRNELIEQAKEISKEFIDASNHREIILSFLNYISQNQLIFMPDFGNSPLQEFIERENYIERIKIREEVMDKIKAESERRVNDCLALALEGNVDEALEVFEKKPYLIHAFEKLHHKVNRNATYDFDEAYVHSLTNTQLSNLIKFYTNYETRFYFRGSVSAIPYLIELLGNRNYENYEELFDWTIEIANSRNPYIPFGTIRYSECKSLKEYKYMLAHGDKRLTRGEDDAEFRHRVRLELQKIKDAKNIWGAIRRKDIAAIKIMIDRGLDLEAVNEKGLTVQEALSKQEIVL